MSEIRILSPEDFDALVHIFVNAYPGLKIEDRARFKERVLKLHQEEPTANFYGLFRNGQLLGIMCLYGFQMNFLNVHIPAGGVGQVAVHLAHKKEHVCKEMILYFLRRCRKRATPFAALYPFRPDFYRQMGFGYGTKMNRYRVKPIHLPKGPSKAHVRYLTNDDREALRDCYQRVAVRTHGMMDKGERELRGIFDRAAHRIVGCIQEGLVRGYLVFSFEHGQDFITNDILVKEFIVETPEASSELLTFLQSQADQIQRITFETQDEDFHHLLLDPRNDSGRLFSSVYHETNAQGVGLMYRVIDIAGMFDLLAERDFGGQTCILKLTIEDSFLPENAGSILLRFKEGFVRRLEDGEPDVEVGLDIAEFSSLLAGTVSFRSLYRYGLVDISDLAYVDTINHIFAVQQKPMCTTQF
ncbi:MAG: GNAT family N-acetyltransferase [Anaerolineae bacterium]|jgi:predicted acetyltransferase